jgi:hypothetical protein
VQQASGSHQRQYSGDIVNDDFFRVDDCFYGADHQGRKDQECHERGARLGCIEGDDNGLACD